MRQVFKVLIFLVLIFNSRNHVFAQLIINEIFITNTSADLDRSDFNYNNWIEIYNPSPNAVLTYDYYLSDDESNLKKWRFLNISLSAKSYLTIYPDEKNKSWHTNFKLKSAGGVILLSNSAGNIIDKVVFRSQYSNISYGRIPKQNGKWGYFSSPTRMAENKSNVLVDQAGSVIFKTRGGFYNNTILLTLASAYGLGEIYYTLNGDEPSDTSIKYSQPIEISKTTVVRARVLVNYKIPSDILTQTYFVYQRIPAMKVVSIVTPKKNLTDDSIGIYVTGKNGLTGNCSSIRQNYNRDWERAANFELFDLNQQQKLNQLTGIEISGACSRGFPQKSLIVSTKDKYGKTRLNYKIYNDRNFENYNSVLLRNSGNDWCNTMFRDAFITKLTDDRLFIEHQAYEPAVLFINGIYYGIQNLYERSNDELLESIYGIPAENLDLCEIDGQVITGSAASYTAIINYIKTKNLAETNAYKYVEKILDIDNFINYNIAQIYSCNHDWPGNNIKYWRQRNPITKWRWIMYDTDFGFGLENNYTTNTLKMALTISNNWPNYQWSTLLLRKLLENEEFKYKFITQFYAHIGSTYDPTRVIGIIDSMANLIKTEIPFHFNRWKQKPTNWEYNVEIMREFARERPAYMRNFLRDTFMLKEDATVTYQNSLYGTGNINFNGVPSVGSKFSGAFPLETKLQVSFTPSPGYRFVKASKKIDDTKFIELIKRGTTWKYFDSGPVNNTNWYTKNFNDSAWKIGNAQLGYGENDEATIISFGTDENKKFITSYFRDTFYVSNPAKLANYKLRLLYDDGAVIYLNGKEAARISMPAGTITSESLGTGPTAENTFYDIPFDTTLIVSGTNTLAVEVHQSSVTSSDVSFDLELSATNPGNQFYWETTQQSFSDTIIGNTIYTAWFEPVTKYNNLVINELSNLNYSIADEYNEIDDWFELYNASDDTINLAGLYLTDSLNTLTKFCIPDGYEEKTIMAPGSYKVIWADGTPSQGPLHVGFKLNFEGEELAVSQKVGGTIHILDLVQYDECFGKHTFGRFPNATGKFKWLNLATPNAVNIDIPDNIENNDNANAFKVLFKVKQNNLYINCHILNTPNIVTICDATGKIILKHQFVNESVINLSNLKPGFYLASVHNSKGFWLHKIVK